MGVVSRRRASLLVILIFSLASFILPMYRSSYVCAVHHLFYPDGCHQRVTSLTVLLFFFAFFYKHKTDGL